MSFKKLLRLDLNDIRITNICNSIHFLHKPENIKVNTYIEYMIINESWEDYAGNKNLSKNYSIQINIFSKVDYEILKDKIEEVLIEKGYRFYSSYDLYEEDTQLYNCVLRFNKKIIQEI